jgi:hypothetical protein
LIGVVNFMAGSVWTLISVLTVTMAPIGTSDKR